MWTIATTAELMNTTDSSFEYTPCNHTNGFVICDKVPLEEVQKLFKRTVSSKLASVQLILQPYIFSETYIPEDVFGSKRILHILIEYPDVVVNSSLSLQVDADAFQSTKSHTNQFTINIIDCTLLDLGFLSGFDKLIYLDLANIDNIQHCLQSLPPLPKLTTLYFKYFTGMNQLNTFPTLTNGLKDFRFFGDVYKIRETQNDETVNRIMEWLLLSSANTLETMAMVEMNQVTQVPHKIASFKALRKLWLRDNNNISSIKSGAFSFTAPVSFLSITDNGITEIEPSAFRGTHNNFIYIACNCNIII